MAAAPGPQVRQLGVQQVVGHQLLGRGAGVELLEQIRQTPVVERARPASRSVEARRG